MWKPCHAMFIVEHEKQFQQNFDHLQHLCTQQKRQWPNPDHLNQHAFCEQRVAQLGYDELLQFEIANDSAVLKF